MEIGSVLSVGASSEQPLFVDNREVPSRTLARSYLALENDGVAFDVVDSHCCDERQ
jgi:hypothetical protein